MMKIWRNSLSGDQDLEDKPPTKPATVWCSNTSPQALWWRWADLRSVCAGPLLMFNHLGFSLQCHQTRSVTQNRKLARDILREKLEVEYKGEESELLRRQKESIQKKHDKRRKVNENIEKKRRFKETLNAEWGDFSIKSPNSCYTLTSTSYWESNVTCAFRQPFVRYLWISNGNFGCSVVVCEDLGFNLNNCGHITFLCSCA